MDREGQALRPALWVRQWPAGDTWREAEAPFMCSHELLTVLGRQGASKDTSL